MQWKHFDLLMVQNCDMLYASTCNYLQARCPASSCARTLPGGTKELSGIQSDAKVVPPRDGVRFSEQAARLDGMLEALDAAGRLPPGRLEELVGDAAAGGLLRAEDEDGREAGRLEGEAARWPRSPSPLPRRLQQTPPAGSPGCATGMS